MKNKTGFINSAFGLGLALLMLILSDTQGADGSAYSLPVTVTEDMSYFYNLDSTVDLELYGTFHAMGTIVTIDAGDDPDQNVVADIAYRISGSGADFQPGYPLDRVSDTRFVGSLFWLDPGTPYDVRVTFSDLDGGPLDGVTVESTGTTRSEITIPPPAHSYYVAPDGSGTDCSLVSPCSLAYGLSRVEAGQEVVLRGGVYYQGELSLYLSGSAGAPIVIRGNVIRRNTFHDRFDGFQVCPASTSALTNETDVYENVVYRVGDDGMEADGTCSNVRIWGNTFHDVLTGVSLSPTRTGPVYAIRNVIYNTGAGNNDHSGTAFKFMYPNSSDGAVYLFHNTSDAGLPGTSGLIVGGEAGTWKTIVARNNIWAGTHYALARYTAAQVVDFDYDDLYTTSPDVFVKWVGLPNPWLSTLAELQAQTDQELNGLNVEPGFAGAVGGDYRLDPNSNLIDAGLIIPGINDQGAHAYQGVAPDIGAFEAPQNYFVCDCATGADPDCEPGDDTNDGTTIATPWRTVEKARLQFGDLSAASSIRFCRGGALDLTSAGDRWMNYRCTAANPCTVGDYTPPWSAGDQGRPILTKTAGHAFRLGEYGDAAHDEGYVFDNLDLRCTACETDNGYGFYLHSDVDDVIIDNVQIDGFDIGVYLGGSSSCASGDPDCDGHNDRLTLQNCTIRNSRRQGFLGGGDDLVIDNCYFESNGTNPIYDHNIYLSDADIYPGGGAGATGIRITNNELYRSAIDSDGDCSAVSLVGHGNFTDLLIEGNVVREDVGQAKPTCWGIAVDAGYESSERSSERSWGRLSSLPGQTGKSAPHSLFQTWGRLSGLPGQTGKSAPHSLFQISSERFENVRIRGNRVINVGSLGIGVSACVDCVIENNVVIHEQAYGTTAIGVPSKNPGPGDAVTTGMTVRNNSIYVTSPDWGIGIRVDSEGAGHTIVSNAMQYAGTSDWWSCLDADLPVSSYDAIDYNVCGYSSGIWAEGAATLADWQALGWGTHSQAATPGFTSAWDLSPASGSAAIVDAGHPALSSPTDIYSYPRDSAPDAGAYEWGGGAACYDFDSSGQVDIADIQTVASRWRDPSQYRFVYDVVPDGIVNVRDAMAVIINWNDPCGGEFQ